MTDKPDSKIDFSDAPEKDPLPLEAEVGRFYRPIKQLVRLRVDADVLAWFRGRGKRYQTYMNESFVERCRLTPASGNPLSARPLVAFSR